MTLTTIQGFLAYMWFLFETYLPLNKAATPCYHGSTSARHEPPRAWRLWPHKPDQVWERPVQPRYTALCNLSGDPHPESPLHWRGAAAWQTGLGTTRRRRCWIQGQRQRGLCPECRCSPPHLLQKTRNNGVHGQKFRTCSNKNKVTMTPNKKVTQNGNRCEGNRVSQSHQIVFLHSYKNTHTHTQHNNDSKPKKLLGSTASKMLTATTNQL